MDQAYSARLTSGWSLSGTTILQSQPPIHAQDKRAIASGEERQWQYNLAVPGGGDYNADGHNLDYPNVVNYSMPTWLQDYLDGERMIATPW